MTSATKTANIYDSMSSEWICFQNRSQTLEEPTINPQALTCFSIYENDPIPNTKDFLIDSDDCRNCPSLTSDSDTPSAYFYQGDDRGWKYCVPAPLPLAEIHSAFRLPSNSFEAEEASRTSADTPNERPTSSIIALEPKEQRRVKGGSQKRKRPPQQNRLAASKCRQKRKDEAHELQETVQRLESRNSILQEEHNNLIREISHAKHLITIHGNCDNAEIDAWIKCEAIKFVHGMQEAAR